MKKILVTLPLVLAMLSAINGQEAITLKDCFRGAVESNPLYREKMLHGRLSELRDRNILSGWYPSLDAGVNLMYNSAVIDLADALSAIPIPGLADNITSMPHEQYKATLDINQVIYDGGIIKGSRDVEQATLRVNEQQVEVELYRTREKVTASFFAILALEKQVSLLESFRETLGERLKTVSAAVDQGVLLASDREVIRAEMIRLDQQLKETAIRMQAQREILSSLTGLEITESTLPICPEVQLPGEMELSRPELFAFDLMDRQLEAGKAVIRSSRRPRAFGFATLGYGKPAGNDFFNDTFAPYAIVGAGIKWNIIDWNKSRRNEEMVDLNREILTARKLEVEEDLARALQLKRAEINSYNALMESDQELASIRRLVTTTAESQLKNGTITATEYLAELNAEKQVLLNHEAHLLSLAKARVEYLVISGIDFE